MNPYIFDPVITSKALNDLNGKSRDYPILEKNGGFAIEARGWFFKPIERSQAFCRTVKVYMDREQVLLVAGIVNPQQANDIVLKLTDYRIRLNQPSPELTVAECREISDIFTASPVRGIHEIENHLLRLIIGEGTLEEIASSTHQMYTTVNTCSEVGKEAYQTINRFFLQETDVLKKRCEQLFPAGLPDSVVIRLNAVNAAIQFAISPQIEIGVPERARPAGVAGGGIELLNKIGPLAKEGLKRSSAHDSGTPRSHLEPVCRELPGSPAVARFGKRRAHPDRAGGMRDICWVSFYDHIRRKRSFFDRPFHLHDLQRIVADISDNILVESTAGKRKAIDEICRVANSLPVCNPGSGQAVKKVRLAGNLSDIIDCHMSYKDFRRWVVGNLTESGLVSGQPEIEKSFFYSWVLSAVTRPVRELTVSVSGESNKCVIKKVQGRIDATPKWVRKPGGRLVRQVSTVQAQAEKQGDNCVLLTERQKTVCGTDNSLVSAVAEKVTRLSISDVLQGSLTAEEKLKEIDLWWIQTIPELKMVDRETIIGARQAGAFDDSDVAFLLTGRVRGQKLVDARTRLADQIKDYQKERNRAERARKFPVEGPLLMPSESTTCSYTTDNDQLPGSEIHELSVQDVSYYFRGIEPAIICNMDEELFFHLLQGFLTMKKLLDPVAFDGPGLLPGEIREFISAYPHWHRQQSFELNFLHFHSLVNNYLVTVNEMEDIQSYVATAYGPYSRLLQQYPVAGMTGFGLTNWGNTAWINTAIQTMVRTISVAQVSQLKAQPDSDLEWLRLTFQDLLTIGQNTLNEQNGLEPAVITLWQRKFIEALIICARGGKLGKKMNYWFKVGSIPDIAQHDSVLFIDGIRDLLGINDDGTQAIETIYYHEALFNGRSIYKLCKTCGMSDNQVQHTLRSSGPVNVKHAELVSMQDWYNSIFAISKKKEIERWLSGELSGIEPAFMRPAPAYPDDMRPKEKTESGYQARAGYLFGPVVAPIQYLLQTREKCLHKIDSGRFTHTILALDITDNQQLARTALLNSARYENNELKIRVFDVNDGVKKVLVLRLTGVTLYKEPWGFYLRLSLVPGKCEEVQRDNISLPFERYRDCLGKEWGSWIEMVEQEKYIPAYCEYKAIRFEYLTNE